MIQRKLNHFKTGLYLLLFLKLNVFWVWLGYYRRFVKDFTTKGYPLTELTHKSKSFVWTQDCQIAFDTLRSSLITDPILSYPTENGEFILDTDASLHGIGAVLSQS